MILGTKMHVHTFFYLKGQYRETFDFDLVESLQSHMILTMSHWSSGLTCLLPAQGSQVQIPWGDLSETRTHLLALSRYIGDPDVIDHQQGFVTNNGH